MVPHAAGGRSRFTGREDDVDAVLRRLSDARLVTVTGCGGIGKTALAQQVRAGLAGESVWVDLSLVGDGSEVAPLLARTLGVGEQSNRSTAEQVERFLAARSTTLCLDNCEHVVEAVIDLITRLLELCPDLRVLATSTIRLDLPDEHIYDLPPLDLPGAGVPLPEVRGSECVRLLVQRVRQVLPDFDVTDENRADVVELCHRLDGLPLAIELAAPRLRVMSPRQLLDRLDRRFGVLVSGNTRNPQRHRGLRALVEWSLERCTEPERVLWARLSVFRGGFGLDCAEQVCGFGALPAEEVLPVLEGLVSRSLLIVERDGEQVSYRQLATIRDYGAELLTARGERDPMQRSLLRYHLGRTRTLVANWCGPDQPLALATWRADHATMLGAVAWAVDDLRRHDEAAELVVLLRYHWVAGGQLSDGRRWLERLLQLSDLSRTRRGHVLTCTAWVALLQGDRGPAAGYLAEAQRIADLADDPLLQAEVDAWNGLRHIFRGENTLAIERYHRAIPVFAAAGDAGAALTARFQLAMAQTYSGDHAGALLTAQEGIAISERSGELWNRAYSWWLTSLCHWHEGRLAESARAGETALQIQRDFADGICVALQLLVLSWVANSRGERPRARRLAALAEVTWGLIGTGVEAFGPDVTAEKHRYSPALDVDARAGLPGTKRAVVEEALTGLEPRRPDPSIGEGGGLSDALGLTRREAEVLPLLVRGRSNRAIAAALVISVRTVEGHVANILAKAGVETRAEIPTWFADATARTVQVVGSRSSTGDPGHVPG